MYGYEKDTQLTKETILTKISQEEIFEFIFERKLDFSQRYTNPLRPEDKEPGCKFEWYNGYLRLVDFATEQKSFNCFTMIMLKYKVTFQEALEIIHKNVKPTNTYEINNGFKKTKKEKFIISVKNKPYSKKGLLYWSKYLIYEKELIEDCVLEVEEVIYTSSTTQFITKVPENSITFSINIKDKFKIYSPLALDRYKWRTNFTENDIGGLDKLEETGEVLVITKSYKDYRVLKNNLKNQNIIWFQNEGMIPSKEICENLISRFKKIVLFFDNDKTGIDSMLKIQNLFNTIKDSTYITHIPIEYGVKDPSDLIYKEGQKDFIKIINKLKLIK